MHSELRHILLGEYCGELACTVVTEVEEDNCVALLNLCKRLAISAGHCDRAYELVGNTLVV